MSREAQAVEQQLIKAAQRLVDECVPIPDKDSAYVSKLNIAELRVAIEAVKAQKGS